MIATRVKDKADAAFKKEERIREGAMTEYQAARLAEEQKTARLKSLRLAQVAAEPAAPVQRKARGEKIGA